MTEGNGHVIDPNGDARRALQEAVAEHGPEVLSNAAVIDTVCRDHLAGLPGESILIGDAARTDVPALLGDLIPRLGNYGAIQSAAATLAGEHNLDMAASLWVVREFARALGYIAPATGTAAAFPGSGPRPVPGSGPRPVPGSGLATGAGPAETPAGTDGASGAQGSRAEGSGTTGAGREESGNVAGGGEAGRAAAGGAATGAGAVGTVATGAAAGEASRGESAGSGVAASRAADGGSRDGQVADGGSVASGNEPGNGPGDAGTAGGSSGGTGPAGSGGTGLVGSGPGTTGPISGSGPGGTGPVSHAPGGGAGWSTGGAAPEGEPGFPLPLPAGRLPGQPERSKLLNRNTVGIAAAIALIAGYLGVAAVAHLSPFPAKTVPPPTTSSSQSSSPPASTSSSPASSPDPSADPPPPSQLDILSAKIPAAVRSAGHCLDDGTSFGANAVVQCQKLQGLAANTILYYQYPNRTALAHGLSAVLKKALFTKRRECTTNGNFSNFLVECESSFTIKTPGMTGSIAEFVNQNPAGPVIVSSDNEQNVMAVLIGTNDGDLLAYWNTVGWVVTP